MNQDPHSRRQPLGLRRVAGIEARRRATKEAYLVAEVLQQLRLGLFSAALPTHATWKP